MRTQAKVYIGTVLSGGAVVLLASILAEPRLAHPAHFAQCFVLAILAATFKVRVPGIQSSISLNFVLFIIGMGALSLTETLLMAVGSSVVQSLWRPRTKPKPVQVLFNAAALSISLFLADLVSGQMRIGLAVLPGLVLAGLVFFVANTWLISLVLGLLNDESPLEKWRESLRWLLPYYSAGAVVAVVTGVYAQVSGWGNALAMLPCVYLLYAYYERHVRMASTT